MKNKVLIFDLDDTLFNEIDFLISAYNEISQFLSNVCGVDKSKNEIFDYMYSTYLRKKNPFEQVILFLKIKNRKKNPLTLYTIFMCYFNECKTK